MRGSPLLRSFLLALALAATAAGLARVTTSRVEADSPARPILPDGQPTKKNGVPFRLVLSAPASEVILDAASPLRPATADGTISGTLEINPDNPSLGLTVRWKNPPVAGEHRFAKLTLEAPGQPTFTHVFDADGDIDDFLELPFPAAK